MHSGVTALKNSLVGSQKIKYRYSMTQQFLGVCPGEKWKHMFTKTVYKECSEQHCRDNRKNVELVQRLSTDEWMSKTWSSHAVKPTWKSKRSAGA